MNSASSISNGTLPSNEEFIQWYATEKRVHAITEGYEMVWRPNSCTRPNVSDGRFRYEPNDITDWSEYMPQEVHGPSVVPSILFAISLLVMGILGMTVWRIDW